MEEVPHSGKNMGASQAAPVVENPPAGAGDVGDMRLTPGS